jgi:hypothetical protein
MSSVAAGQLLKVWAHRLEMNRKGITKEWTPSLRTAVECLVEKLKTIPPGEGVSIDADIDRDPIARFIRVATGEIIGEINLAPEARI